MTDDKITGVDGLGRTAGGPAQITVGGVFDYVPGGGGHIDDLQRGTG